MKSLKRLVFVLSFICLSTSLVMAGGSTKFLQKAKSAVETAGPDDWFVRAKWAKMCISKGINTPEVAKWINKSLEIQENAYTLEVKGDYYAKNKMKKEAMEYYIKSMRSTIKGDDSYDLQRVQLKVKELSGL